MIKVIAKVSKSKKKSGIIEIESISVVKISVAMKLQNKEISYIS